MSMFERSGKEVLMLCGSYAFVLMKSVQINAKTNTKSASFQSTHTEALQQFLKKKQYETAQINNNKGIKLQY